MLVPMPLVYVWFQRRRISIKISDFRPISLVTSLYNFFGKVLVKKLRAVVGETISLSQGAFVDGR